MSHLYAKLGTHSRTEAVERARELGLLAPPHPDADSGLADGAAGNPSLVAELIGGLRDDHAEQVTGGRAVLAAARLPQRIHRLAQRRLAALSGQAPAPCTRT